MNMWGEKCLEGYFGYMMIYSYSNHVEMKSVNFEDLIRSLSIVLIELIKDGANLPRSVTFDCISGSLKKYLFKDIYFLHL